MATVQQGDVLLFNTPDHGDIEVIDGVVTMSGGLETAAYLALFGGNIDDNGTDSTKSKQWWGNLSETEPEKTYRSETQALLKSLPVISGNLRRIETTVVRDLEFFIKIGAASSVNCVATIPGLNKIKIAVTITIEGVETTFEFIENWKADI